MLTPRMIAVLVVLPTLAAVAIVLTPTAADAQAVPDDFKIVAQFGPGYSNLKPWKCTITGDGKVLQEVSGGRGGGEPYEKKFTLTKEEINSLSAKIKEAEFFKLKEGYKGSATDQATLVLDITLNKQTHKVSVYGLPCIRDK